jgi:hypothetical protein
MSDGFGDETYGSFVIAEVVNEDELILDSGPSIPFASAQKGEIHRTLNKTEIVQDLKDRKEPLVHELLCLITPDEVEDGTESVPGYFFAAALAGAISAAAPHQPYHYTEVSGFDNVSKTSAYFGQSHLRELAEAGFVIANIDDDGTIYVLRMNTTDTTDIESREEVFIRNTHGLWYILLHKLAGFRGHSNIMPNILETLKFEGNTALAQIIFESGRVRNLGSMIISGTTEEVRRHATLLDRVVFDFAIERPYPLNETEFQLVV